MKRNNFHFFILVLILIFSFFTRFFHLSALPLFGDEIDVGYQAYSLALTGKDYRGNFLPSYIHSFTESRAPLLMYLSIPAVKIFGLTPLGVRLTPLLFGIISIFFLYKLVLLLTKNINLALLSAFILSITPWHFHYSRHAFEVTLLLALIISALFYFYLFLQSNKFIHNLLFIFLFASSFYTYNTANIITPLLAIFLFITEFNFFKKKDFKFFLFNSVLSIFLVFPIFLGIISGNISDRFQLISIANQPKIVDEIIFKRTGFSTSNTIFEKFFHNRPLSYMQYFFANYISSYDPSFLYLRGDPLPRHGLPQHGLVLAIFLPFFFIGLSRFARTTASKLFLFWLIIAPLPSALTQAGATHATRLFLLLPPLIFFICQGLILLRKNILLLATVMLTIISISQYAHEYFVHYPKEQFESWQYGYDPLFTSLPKSYHRLFISNRYYNSLPQYLFYQSIPPSQIQSISSPDKQRLIQEDSLVGFTLNDQVFFINDWLSTDIFTKIQELAQPQDVFLLFQGLDIPGDYDFSQSPLPGFEVLQIIKNPNSTIFGQVIRKI